MFHWVLPLFFVVLPPTSQGSPSTYGKASPETQQRASRGGSSPRCEAATCARRLAAKLASLAPDQALRVDPALEQAALRHGVALLRRRAHGTLAHIQADLFDEGLADAQFLPYAAIGAPLDGLADALFDFGRARVVRRGYTHVGIAVIDQGLRSAVVGLFVRRLVELPPLPKRPHRPTHDIQGLVMRGKEIEAYVQHPTGWVEALPVRRAGERFTFTVPTDAQGLHRVEVLVHTERGPEVAALWRFDTERVTTKPSRKPHKVAHGRSSVGLATTSDLFFAIQSLRRDRDIGPLGRVAALDQAAGDFARAVCAQRIAAHILPGQGDPTRRTRKVGYQRAVTENVAIAGNLSAAHENLLESPSHLRNLIDPAAREIGLGVAQDNTLTPSIVCVVELFGL